MSSASQASRTIVITGANAGIGKSVALQLAQGGHHVVAVCRDPAKGKAAVDEIRNAIGSNARVDFVQGDLSTVAGVRELATRLLTQYHAIHVLINNAGVWMDKRTLNADGLEMTFMVNHLAPFLLTNLLFDRLKASAPARIVNVNAGLYAMGACDLAKVPTGEDFHKFKTYMHSKLCSVLVTMELARKIEGSGVTINALHPGVIRTNLGASRTLLGIVLKVVKRFWTAPEVGAQPVVRLAIAPELDGVNGKYYDVFKEIPLAANAQNPELARQLWDLSEKLGGS